MKRLRLAALGGGLRSRKVVLGEIAAFVVVGVLGAVIPQVGTVPEKEWAVLLGASPVASRIAGALALDHLFHSPVFAALAVLAAASLSVVVRDQAGRFLAQWRRALSVGDFSKAPFRAEFLRVPRFSGSDAPKVELRTHRKLGDSGSLLFHVGLLLVIIAGAGRALFSAEAAVDMLEGETLPAKSEAWGAQWPGLIARPISLDRPITVRGIDPDVYGDGSLRSLSMELSVGAESGDTRQMKVNKGTYLSGTRIYLGADFGPAALVEWTSGKAPSKREAVLLKLGEGNAYEAMLKGPDGMSAYLRAVLQKSNLRPENVEVRIMKGNALMCLDHLVAGAEVSLPDEGKFRLHGMPLWIRLRASRDPVLWLAYAGFSLVLAGAAVMFMLVRVDTCVSVSPENGQERVFVALRARRFAPFYGEQFRCLVREQGGEEQ